MQWNKAIFFFFAEISAGKEFWSRFTTLSKTNIDYSSTKTATDGICIGEPVKVGMLVYGNTITCFKKTKRKINM